jgi:lipoyl(octanoyl) transferase
VCTRMLWTRGCGVAARRCSSCAASPAPRRVTWFDLGVVPYTAAWRWQQELLRSRTDATSALQNATAALPDVVLCLEHPHVYTLGRGASVDHLKFDPAAGAVDAEVHRVERGGTITYHGPGQLVVYPILQLEHHRKDLHWYVHSIEEVVIRSLRLYGVEATRVAGLPGVWVGGPGGQQQQYRKIAQVGMNCSKWVTTHGFAVNVDPDMRYFGHIVPCGIDDRPVTSLAAELGRPVSVAELRGVVADQFAAVFDVALELPPADCRDDPLRLDALAAPR